MLIVVSPAKKLDMTPSSQVTATRPIFAHEARALAETARDLGPQDLKKLMKISDNLARINAERFRDFGNMPEKPAALAFAGDTYTGLEARTLDPDEIAWAQEHLRILSGLYGLLRPCDAIQPYRLEMGSRLKTERGATLYDWWGSRIAKALNAQGKTLGTDVLINCASHEYFGAVDRKALKLRVITPVFMEERDGTAKIVSFFAKKARGAMARFIIQHRLSDPDSLKSFDSGGYRYRPDQSEADRLVFVRAAESAGPLASSA